MIAGIDDPRIVAQTAVVEGGDDLADVFVEEADQTVVAGQGATHLVFAVEEIIVGEARRVIPDIRMIRAFRLVVELGPRQIVVQVVLVEMLRGRGQREMRCNERDE
ncbi:hypothetical protein D9M69_424960 [compost metagenome]